MDSYLRLFDSTGSEVAANDDDGSGYGGDSFLTFTAPAAGTFSLGVSGSPNSAYDAMIGGGGVVGTTGSYQLLLSATAPPTPANISLSTDAIGSLMLTPSSAPVAFGTVAPGDSVRRTLYVRNTGGAPLTVQSITLPPGFSVVGSTDPFQVPFGGVHAVTIQLSSTDVGIKDGQAIFTSSDDDEPTLSISLQGLVGTGLPTDLDAVNDIIIGVVPGLTTSLDVLANDLGYDLMITAVDHPSASVSVDGQHIIFAAPVDLAELRFHYTITNGTTTDSATVTIQPNRPPVAADDQYRDLLAGVSRDLFVLDNDHDLDGETLTLVSATTPAQGQVTLHGHYLTYMPGADFNGDTFDYTITDTAGNTATATVQLSAKRNLVGRSKSTSTTWSMLPNRSNLIINGHRSKEKLGSFSPIWI